MAFTEITDLDLQGKGNSGQPDVPNLDTADMQHKLDELSLDVIVPKFNNLIAELEAFTASGSLGANLESDIDFTEAEIEKEAGPTNIQDLLTAILAECGALDIIAHTHENKDELDSITDTLIQAMSRLITMFQDQTSVSDSISDDSAIIPTAKAIVAYVQQMGGGDMTKAVYDQNDDGVADVNVEDLLDFSGVPEDKQVLGFDESNHVWTPVDIEVPDGSIAGASDADVENPANADLFIYNGTSAKWENVAPANELSLSDKTPPRTSLVAVAKSDVFETIGGTALQGYSKDELIAGKDGKWYKALTSITQGTTLTVDGNIEETNEREFLGEVFTSVSSGKASVASAITAKGVSTASDATFATMATHISQIPTDTKHNVSVKVQASNSSYATLYVYVDNVVKQTVNVNVGSYSPTIQV